MLIFWGSKSLVFQSSFLKFKWTKKWSIFGHFGDFCDFFERCGPSMIWIKLQNSPKSGRLFQVANWYKLTHFEAFGRFPIWSKQSKLCPPTSWKFCMVRSYVTLQILHGTFYVTLQILHGTFLPCSANFACTFISFSLSSTITKLRPLQPSFWSLGNCLPDEN